MKKKKKEIRIDKKKVIFYSFILVIIIFLLIEVKGLNHVDPGDEFTYFYMGKLLSDGKIFYKDFFYAHPPLQVFLLSVIFKIFGFNLIILKSIPLLAIIISSIYIFKIVQDKFDGVIAILASIIFLFSHRVLFEATYATGVNLTTMLVVIGTYYLVSKNKFLLSGIIFGLAGITRFYSLVPIGIIMLILFMKNRKNFIRFLYGFLLTFALPNILFILFFGQDYLTPVFKYHLMKPSVEGNTFSVFSEVIIKNLFLFIPFFLIFFVKRKRLFLFITVPILYLIFLSFLKTIFNFYFILAFPFMAIAGSYALVYIYRRIKIRSTVKKTAVVLLVIIFFGYNIYNVNKLTTFDFIDFEAGPRLIRYIEENTKENELIFGDDSTTALLSLYSGRDIALDFADSNDMRFKSGVTDIDETIKKLKEEDTRLFIVRPLYGIGSMDSFKEAYTQCKLDLWIKDKYWADFLVFKC